MNFPKASSSSQDFVLKVDGKFIAESAIFVLVIPPLLKTGSCLRVMTPEVSCQLFGLLVSLVLLSMSLARGEKRALYDVK